MAQINKHTIILKNTSKGVAGTVGISEISHNISVKLYVNLQGGSERLILAICGERLPFFLLDFGIAGSVNKTLDAEVKEELGQDITALLIKRSTSVTTVIAYGYCGKNEINIDSMLILAEKRLMGAKIVSPQENIKKEYKKETISDKVVDYEKEYAKVITDDPYIKEDTTLADIDIIASENYFDKDFKSVEKIGGKENSEPVNDKEEEYKNKDFKSVEKIGGKENSEPVNYDNNYIILSDKETKNIKNEYNDKIQNTYDSKNYDEEEEYKNMEYYEKVKSKLLKLLSENEKDTFLCDLISESDFARITYDTDKFYCVGLVRENGKPAYICYGVPGQYSETAPEEFEGCSKWIPADAKEPKNKGYWMMFQNVKDGKCMKT